MLPGVECARRRRFHKSGDSPATSGHGSTRRPAFCLYTSNHDTHSLSSTSFTMQRSSITYHGGSDDRDEKLGGLAREAKERLDERLRARNKPSANYMGNNIVQESMGTRRMQFRDPQRGDSQRGLFGSRKKNEGSNSNYPSTSNSEWKATEQEECAICLDKFKSSDALVSLRCAHRFHSTCLGPWLEGNSQCPCCRMRI